MKLFFQKAILIAALAVSMFLPSIRGAEGFNTGPAPKPAVASVQVGEATRVHLILTGLVNDDPNNIGPQCKKDVLAMKDHFAKTFANFGSDRLEIHTLCGEDVTLDKVRLYLQNMKIGPNDVVIFYQSGHGAIRDAKNAAATSYFQVNSRQDIDRAEVTALLKKHAPRGLILFTDCCSSIVPGLSRGPEGLQTTPTVSLNVETMRNLFLRFQGFVDLTAADIGVPASSGNHLNNYGGASSACTVAFLKVACSEQVYQNWGSFYTALKTMTRTASGNSHQAFAFVISEGSSPQTVTVPATTSPTGPIAQPTLVPTMPVDGFRPERIRD